MRSGLTMDCAMPGDFVVDRAMRRAYSVAKDGSYRRLNAEQAYAVIDKACKIIQESDLRAEHGKSSLDA